MADPPRTRPTPTADPLEAWVRRSWLLLGGVIGLLAVLAVAWSVAPTLPLALPILVAAALVVAAAAVARWAVNQRDARRREEVDNFARILQGFSRAVSPDAIVEAILDELGPGTEADHLVVVRPPPRAPIHDAPHVPTPRGALLRGARDPTDSLYILISGRIKVFMSDLDGKEVILSILEPNEFFGEMGLIDDRPRSASVVALEPCELICISKPDFKRCLAENFDMAMTVMRGLVKRLREADKQIGSLALMDVFGRVARLLLETAELIDGEKVVTRKLSKQDIARMIGASREMVSRVMKHLQEAGYIEVRTDTIVIRDNILLAD